MARNARTPPCPTPTPAPTIAQCHSIPSIRIERSKEQNGMAEEIVSAPKPTPPPRTVTYGNTLAPIAPRVPRQPRQTSLRSSKCLNMWIELIESLNSLRFGRKFVFSFLYSKSSMKTAAVLHCISISCLIQSTILFINFSPNIFSISSIPPTKTFAPLPHVIKKYISVSRIPLIVLSYRTRGDEKSMNLV